ncbi:hypothetical protein XACLG98_2200012 [Xanthomonas citri pv. citri]|nr:hypothetical protein XACLG98_2200012 [Xanthomonas citri pv. citri]
MQQVITADRGLALALDSASESTSTTCLAVSRLGSIRTSAATFTLWIQLRGRAWVESKEGRFRLRAGDWIAFDKDSHPTVQADRSALCVGVGLDGESLQSLAELTDATLYPGRAQLSRGDLRIALRLWRNAAAQSGSASARPLLLHLAAMQRDFIAQEQRCPGRSRSRRRQVFGRMQRARLYLEGNSDRMVRISELAQLTNFSRLVRLQDVSELVRRKPASAVGTLASGACLRFVARYLDDDRRGCSGKRLRQLLQLRACVSCALRCLRIALPRPNGKSARFGKAT